MEGKGSEITKTNQEKFLLKVQAEIKKSPAEPGAEGILS